MTNTDLHAARRARASAYLKERIVTREGYIENGKQYTRWVEQTHYDYDTKGSDDEDQNTPPEGIRSDTGVAPGAQEHAHL